MSGKTSSSQKNRTSRLAKRRQKTQTVVAVVALVLFLFGIAGALWGLWQPVVRISKVTVINGDASLLTYTEFPLMGSYVGIVPRNSIFFFPERTIRADILADRPELAAVSISRDGLDAIALKAVERVPVARWCGIEKVDAEYTCFFFDAGGYIYGATDAFLATHTLNPYKLFAPISGSPENPVRASILSADSLPGVFDFARHLADIGGEVVSIRLHEDEVDFFLLDLSLETEREEGTRITYILGQEELAFTALVSSQESYSLSNGSIEYIDLRFSGKVYLKRKE